jgi:hypothetical protein
MDTDFLGCMFEFLAEWVMFAFGFNNGINTEDFEGIYISCLVPKILIKVSISEKYIDAKREFFSI